MKKVLYAIIVLFIVVWVSGMYYNSTLPEEEVNTDYNSTNQKLLIYNFSEDFVKRQLKSPATAEFPGSREKLNAVVYLDSGRYKINSYVDSQNSFGALIRTNFTVVVRYEDKKVVLESLSFD